MKMLKQVQHDNSFNVMKKQVVCIHGGMVFDDYEKYLNHLRNYQIDLERQKRGNWKEALQKDLGEDFEVILPKMPSKYNARYVEWSIWLDNFLPHLKDGVILVGSSLGSTFLAKYLEEKDFPVRISQLHLVAPPFDDESEELLGDFAINKSLGGLKDKVGKIFIYHSKDDPVVKPSEMDKYAKELPEAELVILDGRGHFNREMKIPELLERIKSV